MRAPLHAGVGGCRTARPCLLSRGNDKQWTAQRGAHRAAEMRQFARGHVESRHGFVEDEDTRIEVSSRDAPHLAAGEIVDAARVRRPTRFMACDDPVAVLTAQSFLATLPHRRRCAAMPAAANVRNARRAELEAWTGRRRRPGVPWGPAERHVSTSGPQQTGEDARVSSCLTCCRRR